MAQFQREYRAGTIHTSVRSVLENMTVGPDQASPVVLDGEALVTIIDSASPNAQAVPVSSIAPGPVPSASLPSGESLTGIEGAPEVQAAQVLDVLEKSLNGCNSCQWTVFSFSYI